MAFISFPKGIAHNPLQPKRKLPLFLTRSGEKIRKFISHHRANSPVFARIHPYIAVFLCFCTIFLSFEFFCIFA